MSETAWGCCLFRLQWPPISTRQASSRLHHSRQMTRCWETTRTLRTRQARVETIIVGKTLQVSLDCSGNTTS